MIARALTFLLVTPVLVSCYTYVPATLETVPEGSRVRALISTEAQIDLERRIGLDARELEGDLVERSTDRVLLAVKVPPPATGLATTRALRQRIDLAPRDVLRLDVRKTDGARTALLLGGIAGAATLGIVAVLEGGNPGQGPNGGGPPPEQIVRWVVGVPLIRF